MENRGISLGVAALVASAVLYATQAIDEQALVCAFMAAVGVVSLVVGVYRKINAHSHGQQREAL